ncbi:MAG: TolC family protein [Bacteroidales bacterium]
MEYKLLQKQVDLKKQNERLVSADFLPSVGIDVQYDYLAGPKVNGYYLPHNLAFAALAVKIPIAHWGEGSAKVRSAKAALRLAYTDYRRTLGETL